jgi:hypothetical protein
MMASLLLQPLKIQNFLTLPFRQHGLQLTIHFAEIDNPDENHYIIHELRPGRIGHGTCVNDELEKDMLENPIPLGMPQGLKQPRQRRLNKHCALLQRSA